MTCRQKAGRLAGLCIHTVYTAHRNERLHGGNDSECLPRPLCVCVFGVPLTVHSDQGTHLTSIIIVFEYTCKDLGIEHQLGSTAHARSQGQVERQTQLIDNVRCVAGENPASWQQALVAVKFAHNSAKNVTVSTGNPRSPCNSFTCESI